MDSVTPSDNPDPRKRLQWMEELFHDASQRTSDERLAFLQQSCPDDPDMVDAVLGLLEAELAINELKSSPPASAEAPNFLEEDVTDRWIGRVLGGYRLERLLGRGGMGVVYLAHRSADDLTQRVAVKLTACHLQSTPAQTQFLMEREALAQLEHPNISRLLDGGVTPEGLPYLVMEYVQGQRLDAVCDAVVNANADTNVTTLRRIAWLMVQLCEAVSYVHRNLILHRDLKPGNVMVTDEGSVKLLDFGTLKGIGARFAGDSEMTQAGMRSLTLRYASPEQIRGQLPSTAMDVYSLGMILYRLIAGHLPELPGEPTIPDYFSIPDYLKQLERAQFPPPSRSGPARRRQLDPMLASDLDAIALKALRYSPGERYDGADALAADLRRALERRPVAAKTGTLRYRSELFLRRNRVLVLGTVAAALVLAIGVAAMAHQAAAARADSRRADAGVDAERKVAHLLLFDYFDQVKRIPGSTDAQRRAVGQALNYLNSLSPRDMTPELQLEAIQAYVELGNLQDSPYEENIGDLPGAIKTMQMAVSSANQLVAQQPTNIRYLSAQALAERSLGSLYQSSSNPLEAIGHLLKATAIYGVITRQSHVPMADLQQAVTTQDILGDCYGLPGAGTLMDTRKAIESYRNAQALDKAGLALDPDCTLCRRGVGIEAWKIGSILGTSKEAESAYREGLASYAALPASEQGSTRSRRLLTLLQQNLGMLYLDTGRDTEGFVLIAQVHQRMLADIAADPMDGRARMDLALFDDDLADVYHEQHNDTAQLEPAREFLAMMDTLVRADPTNALKQFRRGKALSHLGSLNLSLGRMDAGRRQGIEAISVLLPLAQKPGASARVLDVTSDALITFHPSPREDAGLAVELAQRAVRISPQPGVEQYLALAHAQKYANLHEDSVATAQTALRMLAVHPRSLSDQGQIDELNAIVQGRW